MNNEILEKLNYLKLGVDNAKTKNSGWLPVPLSHLIPLLNELECINNLKPVVYASKKYLKFKKIHIFIRRKINFRIS